MKKILLFCMVLVCGSVAAMEPEPSVGQEEFKSETSEGTHLVEVEKVVKRLSDKKLPIIRMDYTDFISDYEIKNAFDHLQEGGLLLVQDDKEKVLFSIEIKDGGFADGVRDEIIRFKDVQEKPKFWDYFWSCFCGVSLDHCLEGPTLKPAEDLIEILKKLALKKEIESGTVEFNDFLGEPDANELGTTKDLQQE